MAGSSSGGSPVKREDAAAVVKLEDAAAGDNDLVAVKREHIEINYDPPAAIATSASGRQVKHEDTGAEDAKADDAACSVPDKRQPPHWREVLDGIRAMRAQRRAPVDDMGCSQVADRAAEPHVFRYQTLVALQLSSQTKDPVTAAAVASLRSHKPGGLTIDSVLAMTDAELDAHICKVGFHNRKTVYLKQTAQILKDRFGGDIPRTVDDLMALPGVGPKMAHLTMQAAWGVTEGIGVDTHVHRISHRLGWTKRLATPEHTRKELEDWLPRPLWAEINHLLVGFGQTVCVPIGPRCGECAVAALCPKVGTRRGR
ncbi:alpha,alpha-trehalase nth1 [Polyrhizophydium stewartii]|uniref:Endonuclease III homolog n=1 Tax=Polyrhizophydium stewartii TaxID=2732419 RepID=A0ABR4MXR7_9FUNG